MTDFLSDVEWESENDGQEAFNEDIEIEIDLPASDNFTSTKSSKLSIPSKNGARSSSTKRTRVIDAQAVEEAAQRHCEDLAVALNRAQAWVKACHIEILLSLLQSAHEQCLPPGVINTLSLHSLTLAMSCFRELGYTVTSSRFHLANLTRAEQMPNGNVSILTEMVTSGRSGTHRHINQLLFTYLTSLGFDVRLVCMLRPCSHKPRVHKDLLQSASRRRKRAKSNCSRSEYNITPSSVGNTSSKGSINQNGNVKSRYSHSISANSSADSAYSSTAIASARGSKSTRSLTRRLSGGAALILNANGNSSEQNNAITVDRSEIPSNNNDEDEDEDNKECGNSDANSDIDNRKNSFNSRNGNLGTNNINSDDDDDDFDVGGSESSELIPCVWLEVFLALPPPAQLASCDLSSPPPVTPLNNGSSSSGSSAMGRWVHVDYHRSTVDNPALVESYCKANVVAYAVAIDAEGRVTDVTARYSSQYHQAMYQCRPTGHHRDWWTQLLHDSFANTYLSDVQKFRRDLDELELRYWKGVRASKLPATLAGLKQHPYYVLETDLRWNEMYCSVFAANTCHSESKANPTSVSESLFYVKGERVLLRSFVETLYTRREWRLLMRTVRDIELTTPAKIARRAIPRSRGEFREIRLFRYTQTEPYVVPSVLDGVIPVNSHGNVEIWGGDTRLVPNGAVLVKGNKAITVAGRLMLPFAPALFEFKTSGDRRVPVIGGAVVLSEHGPLVKAGVRQLEIEKELKEREQQFKRVLARWETLVSGILLRTRLKKTYGRGSGTV